MLVQRSNAVLATLKYVRNFWKEVGPFRNRETCFVVVSVFKVRHEFNRKIRHGKKQVKIFPVGGDPMTLPRKISFQGSIQKEKVVLCYRCKTRHMLGESCPKATPTPEDSGMSFTEQSGTPRENLAPVIPESSVDICLSGKSQLKSSPLVEKAGRENYSMGETSSNSDSGSGSESSATTDSQLESLAEPEILRRNCPACHFRKTHL